MQYQSLMEARPRGLLETLEPALVRHLAIAGVLHLLPFLATLPSLLPHLDDNRLREVRRVNCLFVIFYEKFDFFFFFNFVE